MTGPSWVLQTLYAQDARPSSSDRQQPVSPQRRPRGVTSTHYLSVRQTPRVLL